MTTDDNSFNAVLNIVFHNKTINRIEYVTIAVNRNLSNCGKAQKKDLGASTGFEPMASALALQCSTSLSYEDPYTGGRPIYWVHQPAKGMKHRMKWCELQENKWIEYVAIAVNRNLSNCDSLRWSHTQFLCLPAVHIISFCGKLQTISFGSSLMRRQV